ALAQLLAVLAEVDTVPIGLTPAVGERSQHPTFELDHGRDRGRPLVHHFALAGLLTVFAEAHPVLPLFPADVGKRGQHPPLYGIIAVTTGASLSPASAGRATAASNPRTRVIRIMLHPDEFDY